MTPTDETPADRTPANKPPERSSQVWALLLIGLGVFFLAGNFGWLGWSGDWPWALLFISGGAVFLYQFTTDRRHWWALIPGFTLLGVAAAILGGEAAGGWLLGLIGAGFAAVYLTGRSRWWALIPAGVMLTLGGVAWLDAVRPGVDAGWVLFLGIAVTFGLLFFLPEADGRQRWAVYPALAALALAVVIFVSTGLGGVLLPLLLVAGGVFLLRRPRRKSEGSSESGDA